MTLGRLSLFAVSTGGGGGGIPTTFLELFGGDLKHLWYENYNDTTGTFPDVIGAADADNDVEPIPALATINGHAYPDFDGTTSLKGPDISTLDGSSDFCIFVSCNFGTLPNSGMVFGKVDFGIQFDFEYDFFNSSIYVTLNNGSGGHDISSTTPVSDGNWHRLILNCVGGVVTFYIDGVSQGSSSGLTLSSFPGSYIYFGKKNTDHMIVKVPIAGIATKGLTNTELGYLNTIMDNWIGNPVVAPAPTFASLQDYIIDPLGNGRTQRLVGTNFQNGASVSVGGSPATSVTYVSPTLLTCLMPAKTLPTVPRYTSTATIDLNVLPSTAFSASAGSGFILFRAKERAAKSGSNYANGNLISDLANATFSAGYSNKGVHVCVYDSVGAVYTDVQFDCNVLDGQYHCLQFKWDGVLLYLRLDNNPWKVVACGAVSWPSEGSLNTGVTFGAGARHKGEIALIGLGPIVISDADFDSILANIHRRWGINLGIAKASFDWTALALESLFEPGNFDTGTGNWTGTISAGGSGALTATGTVTVATPLAICFDVTVTNPDAQAASLTSAVRYWDPSTMFGVDDRGTYIDSRKGLTITAAPDIDSITDQVNGNVFTANGTKPQLIASAFGGFTDAIRSDEVPPLVVGYEGTALIGTRQTIPNAGRQATFLSVVNTTSTDTVADWYSGNQPNTIIGDSTGGIENTFGMSGDKLSYAGYRGGWQQKEFGNGFNDGSTRALIVTADYLNILGSDARAFVGRNELGFESVGYDSTLGYDTLFGSYIDGSTHAGDSFKGDIGCVVVIDSPCPIDENELEIFENWSAQSFGAISELNFDPRFTGPTALFLPNGYDATTSVWKAAVGLDIEKGGAVGPADAGDGTPNFSYATDWWLEDPAAVDTAPRFEDWAGLKKPFHWIIRTTTTATNSWGPHPYVGDGTSLQYNNPALVKDTTSWRGITLYTDGATGFFVQLWDYDATSIDAAEVEIDVGPAGLALVDGTGIGEFIVEGKKVYDAVSAKWEIWLRVSSPTVGAPLGEWKASALNNTLGDTGNGRRLQVGAISGNIKAVATYRRDLSEWTATKMVEFFRKISTPDTIVPYNQPDCEAWWDTRSIVGTVGSGGGTTVIKNQSRAHPETLRDLTEVATDGVTFLNTQTLVADPLYNNESVINFTGDGVYDSQIWSSIVDQKLRIYFVANWSTVANNFLLDCTPTDPQATTRVALLDDGVDGWYLYAGNSPTGGTGVTVPHVACAIFDGASSQLYVKDSKTPVFTADAGALAMVTARLGGRFSSSNFFSGKWAAMGVFKGRGDYFERKRMFDLLSTRYVQPFLPFLDTRVISIAFDGTNIWASSQQATNATTEATTIQKINPNHPYGPAVIERVDLGIFSKGGDGGTDGMPMRQIRAQGQYIFVCIMGTPKPSGVPNNWGAFLAVVDKDTNQIVGRFDVYSSSAVSLGVRSICFDGSGNCYVGVTGPSGSSGTSSIHKINIADMIAAYPASATPAWTFDTTRIGIENIAYEGGHVWITHGQQGPVGISGVTRINDDGTNEVFYDFTTGPVGNMRSWGAHFAHGYVWISGGPGAGSTSTPLLRFDPATFPSDPTLVDLTPSSGSFSGGQMISSDDNYIYFGGYQFQPNVFRIDPTTATVIDVINVTASGRITDGCYDGASHMFFIGRDGGGLYRVLKTAGTTTYDKLLSNGGP